MTEHTAEEEAVAEIRMRLERDDPTWADIPDEVLGKLAATQWLALNIALRRLAWAVRDGLPAPIRRWFT